VATVNAPRLQDDGAWRRLAAAGMTKGSGVTGALMAAFSAQECANYVRHAGYASKRPESVLS